MNKIAIAKSIARFVVGTSAAHCASSIITNSLKPESVVQKVEVVVGAVAIGGMVQDAAKTWTDKQIDELVEAYDEHIRPKFKK